MMHPYLHRELSRMRTEELGRAAFERQRAQLIREEPVATRSRAAVTLRFGFPDDDAALSRLAALDSAAIPAHPLLVAEVDGEMRAALSLADGRLIADPLYRTVELAELLCTRAGHLASPRRHRWAGWSRIGYAVRGAALRRSS